MLYSVVIPCYRSDQTIEHVVDQTREEMVRLGRANVEFVLVNDCSPDGGKTIQVLRKMAAEHRDVKVIDLARNSGQHNALMAALRHADGDVIIGMDDDGQTHPSQLGKLFETFDQGYDLVYGYYPEKKHNWFRNLGSKFNDLTINMMINKPKDVRTSSYFLVRKFVRDYAIQYKGWPSLMCAITFFFGLNFMFLGMIGEYLGRMFLGMNREPQYVIKAMYNVSASAECDVDIDREVNRGEEIF